MATKKTTASKPKSTTYSSTHPDIKYQFLCAATAGNLNRVRKRLGLALHRKHKNGNIALQCNRHWGGPNPCKYRAVFVAKKNALFEIAGRAHNHRVKVLANDEEKEEGSSSANAAQKGFSLILQKKNEGAKVKNK